MISSSIEECFRQINFYLEAEPGSSPLIVNAENFHDYNLLRENLSASLNVINVSDYAGVNKIPNIDDVFNDLSAQGDFVVFGLAQFFMLQGENVLRNFIVSLFNFRRLRGHVVVVLFGCSEVIQNYIFMNKRAQFWCVLFDGVRSRLPELCFIKYTDFADKNYCEGFQQMLQALELFSEGSDRVIFIHIAFSQVVFGNSIYPVSSISDPYSETAKKFGELWEKVNRSFGTEEEWLYLYRELKLCGDLPELILKRFGLPDNFPKILAGIFSQSSEPEKWLFWLSMKILYQDRSDYLGFVLSFTQDYTQLVHEIYCAILTLSTDDARFNNFYLERKIFMQRLPKKLTEIYSVLEHSVSTQRAFPFYLTDIYEDEKFEFLKLLSENEFSDDEIYDFAEHSFPELRLYLEDFTFDRDNTQLREKDADFRDMLNDYFHDYKLLKVRNRLDANFLARVEEIAREKPFYKLQLRSSVLQVFNPDEVQAYFFDALGVEFLSYIVAKAREYELNCEIKICCCNLPSTTEFNKEFMLNFKVRRISSLDDLKHKGVTFDYSFCRYPLHVFHELAIIDEEIRRISAGLMTKKFDRALVISDHGASRLAVIYQQALSLKKCDRAKFTHDFHAFETSKKRDRGQLTHVFSDLRHFQYDILHCNSRTSEVHGGTTLEEVTVPIILLSRQR